MPPSTTKKDDTRRKTIQQQTLTAKNNKKKQTQPKRCQVVKKKNGKKKTKKTDKTALSTPKLHNANGNTIVTHRNYTPQQPYAYEVQSYDESQPKYTPFVLKNNFLPKFRLPAGVTPSVDAVCTLSL